MRYTSLIARLTATADLIPQDRAVISALPSTIETFRHGAPIMRRGDRATRCAIIVSGFLAREKITGSRNQILSFHVPGDMPDVHTLHLPVMDHDLRSAGPSTIAFVAHSTLSNVLAKSATLTHTFWRETLIDAAIFREWVANLGSRQALERLAHLFCELASRLEVVGLMEDRRFQLPFTQSDLADACGLSGVHVNRTVKELRRRNLLTWESQMVEFVDRKALEELAEFDPDYLHQRPAGGR